MPGQAPPGDHWANLRKQLTELLTKIDPNGKGVNISSIWTEFQRVNKTLPTVKQFKVVKRVELLEKRSGCEIFTKSGVECVRLLSARAKTHIGSGAKPVTNETKGQKLESKGVSKPVSQTLSQSQSKGKSKQLPEVVRGSSPALTKQQLSGNLGIQEVNDSEFPALGSEDTMHPRRHSRPQRHEPYGPGAHRHWSPHHSQERFNPPQYHQGPGPYNIVPQTMPLFLPQQNLVRCQGQMQPSPHTGYSRNDQRSNQSTVSKDQLGRVVEDCIERLSESKEFVSCERIERLLLEHYKVSKLSQLGVHKLEHIKQVSEHMRTQCKVNLYVEGFVKVRSIVTVFELAESLRDYVTNNEPFEQLHLGPLLKQPSVYDHFKMPEDGDILEITTADVLQSLRDYLSENNLWVNKGLDMEAFLKFMTEQRGVDNPYELGVRIRSMPLAISVLKKAQRDCGQTLRSSLGQMKENVEKDLARGYQMFTDSILTKEPGLCLVKKQYLNMKPDAVLEDVMHKMIILCETIVNLGDLCEISKRETKDLRQTISTSHQFMQRLRSSSTARQLFQIAVSCGRDELHTQLTTVLAQLNIHRAHRGSGDDGHSDKVHKPQPSIVEVVESLLELFDRCLYQGSLTLTHLARVEDKLLEKFDFSHFTEMTSHTFLTFMLSNERVKKYVEECGGSSLGLTSSTAHHSGSTYLPRFPDLLDLMRQCHSPSQIEGVLCRHYSVKDVAALGHGSLVHLEKAASKQLKAKETHTYYEGALTNKNSGVLFETHRRVGVLGSRTRDQALACLQNCPLLEDMAEWSQWSLVYEPELGGLKDFVQKYGGFHQSNSTVGGEKAYLSTNILALETQPGKLLKLTGETSPDKFNQVLQSRDPHLTAGHLVSLIGDNKGMDHSPLALLANHMKTALLQMQAKASDIPGGPGTSGGQQCVVQFVLECLVHMPLVTCQALANQVLLEPLSHVIGQANSKELLLKRAVTLLQQNRLHSLGLLLGIGEWCQSYEERCVIPNERLVKVEKIDLGHGEVIDLESSSSSEEDDSDSDSSVMDFLSDDDDVKVISATSATEKVMLMSEEEEEATDEGPDTSVVTVESRTDASTASSEDNPTQNEEHLTVTNTEEREGRGLIESIRRDEFGVDVELSEDGQKLMEKQQERLGRSLERLSHDLYSKDTHFVLELIQNADDNDYPAHMLKVESEVKPTVVFTVHQDLVVISNNEKGFVEKNIRAICDVGRSTKGKHKAGYIGQKGIGFKSVFRVTDKPEIHSNGYHFCFDVNSGPTGYILPHWLDTPPPSVGNAASWSTNIVLPLKGDVSGQAQSLVARFHDIHPSLLLFLHRLRGITMIMDDPHDQGGQQVKEMVRTDRGEHLVEITHSHGQHDWLVIRKTLSAKHISQQAKSGVEVESTEIAMAFPIQTAQQLAAKVLPEKQPVFAFLPLRSYGFRFIVQGDFDVPSSREDVDKDSVWNQWLRSELHTPFIDALRVFKDHPSFSHVEAVCRFLQFVPVEDEILDFFHPVARSIISHLRAEPCLPTQATKEREITWKLPSQLVLANDHLIREVITSQLLSKHLSLDYLHEDVAAMLNPNLAQSLGIQTLTSQHLLEVGKAITTPMAASGDEKGLVMLAMWLACVYRSLDELHPDSAVIDALQTLPIMPLADGTFSSINDKVVFFPLEQRQGRHNRGILSRLESSLSTLHPALLSGVSHIISSQVERLLSHMGVKRHTPHDIIHHHILPALKSPCITDENADLLVAYVVFIKEQLDIQPKLVLIDDLRQWLVVHTNHGLQKLADHPVHFTQAFGNTIDLARILPGYPWVLLDACYIQTNTATEKHQWREFFSKLGVLDFLSFTVSSVTVNSCDLENTVWAGYKQLLPDTDCVYVIKDHSCEQLTSLITNNRCPDQLHQQMVVLYKLLRQYWDSHFIQHTVTQLQTQEGQFLKEVDTTFALTLKNKAWVPATRRRVQEETDCGALYLVPTEELMYGKHLFLASKELCSLLAYHVPYLQEDIGEPCTLAQFLGVYSGIKPEFVKNELKKWCCRSDEEIPCQFITSMQHIKEVYTYLSDNLTPHDLRNLFKVSPVVFFPTPPDPGAPKREEGDLVKGLFYRSSEVRWQDPTKLFHKYKSSMSLLDKSSSYRQEIGFIYQTSLCRNLFVISGGVQDFPSPSDYSTLLVHITSSNAQERVIKDVHLIMYTIAGLLMKGSREEIATGVLALKKVAKENKILPTKSQEFVTLESKPMIANSMEYEKLFRKSKGHYQEGVHFIEIGEHTHESSRHNRDQDDQTHELVRKLYRMLDIPLLTECLEENVSTESFRPSPDLQLYVGHVVPYIQLLLYRNHPDVYHELSASGVCHNLQTMKFASVGKLEAVYYFRDRTEAEPVIQQQTCHMTHQTLSIQHDHMTDYRSINRTLASFFSRSDTNCANAIRNLLTDLHVYVVEGNCEPPQHFLDEQGLLPLLDDVEEMVWRVPPPYMPPQPPAYHESVEEDAMVTGDGAGCMQQQQQQPEDGGGGLKAWPPQSNPAAIGLVAGSRPTSTPSQWPPPAPPKYYERGDLPANLRPSRLTKDGQEGEPSQSDGEALSRQVSSDTQVTAAGEDQQATALSRQSSESGTKVHESPGGISKQMSDSGTARESVDEGEDNLTQKGLALVPPAAGRVISPGEMVVTAEPGVDQPLMIEFSGPRQQLGGQQHRKRPRLETEIGAGGSHPQRMLMLSGHPAWMEQASDVDYEELGSGDSLPVPTEYSLEKDAQHREVAMWGEVLVKQYLEQLMEDPLSPITNVSWSSESDNPTAPYDFHVRLKQPTADGLYEMNDVFIEVKTTASDSKAFCEISLQEINFAQEKKGNFHLYRVFNAGKPNLVRLSRLENIASQLVEKRIKLCLVV